MRSRSVFSIGNVLALGGLLLLTCVGCGEKEQPKHIDENEIAARFRDKRLTRKEIRAALPQSIKGADSAALAKRYIDEWKKEQLLVSIAHKEIDDLDERIEPQVQDYKRKLAVYNLQEKIIKDQVDTFIKKAEIEYYYKKNIVQFISTGFQYYYVYIKSEKPVPADVGGSFTSPKVEARKALETWCKTNGAEYKLDDSYLDRSHLLKLEREAKAGALSEAAVGSLVRGTAPGANGKNYNFYFYLFDAIKPGKYLPLDFVWGDIKRTIINNRKAQAIVEYESQRLQEARANNEFE